MCHPHFSWVPSQSFSNVLQLVCYTATLFNRFCKLKDWPWGLSRFPIQYKSRILGWNPDKSLQSFPPCYFQSPLQLCLAISISSNFKLTQPLTYFYSSVSVHCKEERRKTWWKTISPSPIVKEIHTETSSLKTLKIMLRNLNEIVCLWIQLQYCMAKYLVFF